MSRYSGESSPYPSILSNIPTDDASGDPSSGSSKGNQIDALLNADEGTVQMLMGIQVEPPKSKLADDLIGKFDAIRAMQMGVFEIKDIPTFPALPDQSTNWPAPPGSDPLDVGRYDKVKEIWLDDSKDELRNDCVEALRLGFGWSEGLSGGTPKRLVEDLGNLYMRAPNISHG